MNPVHTVYGDVPVFEIPQFITFRTLLSGRDTNGTHAIFEDHVHPGQGPGLHIHHHQDETFLFEAGIFDVEIEGIRYHMKEGDVGFVPRGSKHAFKNVGTTEGRLRYIMSPAGSFEEMIPALHALLTSGDATEEQIHALAFQHGNEIVGPPIE